MARTWFVPGRPTPVAIVDAVSVVAFNVNVKPRPGDVWLKQSADEVGTFGNTTS